MPRATIGRPRFARGHVPRPRVLRLLADAGAARLVVVAAPAGCGKTTTVAQWDDIDDRPFAWVRIDHLDADPAHLLLHVATAVADVVPLDGGLLSYLRGPGRPALTHLVPAVVRALEAVGPVVIVLDDAHLLCEPDAVDVVHALVDQAPADTSFAVLGRQALPLNLSRRRLAGELVELGTDALLFSEEEAAAAFHAVSGVDDEATVNGVLAACEGWPAGVIMAALAVRNGAQVDAVAGTDTMVIDYLVEEVLDGLDDETSAFLLDSSVMDRFNAAQLDVVLGRDDSGRMLDELSTSGNLFLVALDHDGVWYRYHRLFGDALRARLRAWSPKRFGQLAIRAADRLEHEGDIDAALLQAVAAEDRRRAAALVSREAVRLGFDGRAGVLARRLALLDERTFTEYPDAAMARAWLGVTTGDAALIHRSLMLAHRADRGAALSDGTPSVKVAAALVSSLIGVSGIHDVIHQADVVRAAGDHCTNPWWGAATVMKGAAEAMLGHTSRARLLLESALPVTGDLPGFQAGALAHLALLDLGAGDDEGAVARSDEAKALADKFDLCDVVPMVVVYAVSAVMAARIGNSSAARESIELTEKLLNRLGRLAARTALLGHGLLAWTAAALEDADLLSTHLEAAERARQREPDATALAQRVERVRAMAVGGARPLTAAELRLLPHLATHMSLQQIADELVIGRETAKTQAAAVYRKLGVSSRADAVAEAERIGLLPTKV